MVSLTCSSQVMCGHVSHACQMIHDTWDAEKTHYSLVRKKLFGKKKILHFQDSFSPPPNRGLKKTNFFFKCVAERTLIGPVLHTMASSIRVACTEPSTIHYIA